VPQKISFSLAFSPHGRLNRIDDPTISTKETLWVSGASVGDQGLPVLPQYRYFDPQRETVDV
jgi:hypothetical protein